MGGWRKPDSVSIAIDAGLLLVALGALALSIVTFLHQQSSEREQAKQRDADTANLVDYVVDESGSIPEIPINNAGSSPIYDLRHQTRPTARATNPRRDIA